MRCPFAPYCGADLDITTGDSIIETYPPHGVQPGEGANPATVGMTCPGSGVRMMRDGRPHASEHARLAEQLTAWSTAEAAWQRDRDAEQAERDRRAELRIAPSPEDAAREAAEFDAFAERAARAIEERHRRRIWPERDMPIARDGLDEQTIREILDDDSHRLVDRDDSPDAARSGPGDREQEQRDFFNILRGDRPRGDGRRHDDPDDNVVPLRRGETPPGFPVGRGQTRPDDEYPSGAELDPELDLTPVPIEGHEDDIEGYAVGAGPDRPIDEFYPGRPADAPEPGPGDPPAARVPLDTVRGEHLGRSAVDNARDQLRQLLAAVIEQGGQAQEVLAKATAMTDSVAAYRLAAQQAMISAESLMNVAIGQTSDVPQPAQDMRAAILTVKDQLADEGGTVVAALEKLREEIATTHREIGAAAESAREYAAIP